MKKSFLKERIKSLIIKEFREKDGIPVYHFVNLEENEIPNQIDVGKHVYYAGDVIKKNYSIYQLLESYYDNNNILCFSAVEIVDNEKGNIRQFYQTDLILIPNQLLPKHLWQA